MIAQSFERLAEVTGEHVDDLRHWASQGLLRIAADDSRPNPLALEQIRLLQLLRRRGFDVEAIAAAELADPGMFARYAELVGNSDSDIYTVNEAAAAYDLDAKFVRRVWEASGLAEQGDAGSEEDVEALRVLDIAVKAGLPEDALVQVTRVYADAMNRIAEATARLFHFHVHERLRSEGIEGDELAQLTGAASAQLIPLVEPTVLHFHRKALVRAFREDIALHLAQDAGLLTGGDTTGQLPLAVTFVDLANFTPMTETMGDVAAAQVLDRFSALVRRAVLTAGGRVVKQIGDEFMLVFPDPPTAVRAALEIRGAATREPSFLATRIGIHHGPVLCREGDYIGTTVNIAARITAQAAPHQLLVSEPVRDAAQVLVDVTFAAVGSRALKGIENELELYEATAADHAHPAGSSVDPVCGMTVDATSAPSRIEHHGREIIFCSKTCREKFLADPQRYSPEFE